MEAEPQSGSGAVTIYGSKVADVAEQQWPKLLDGVKITLSEKLCPDAPNGG